MVVPEERIASNMQTWLVRMIRKQLMLLAAMGLLAACCVKGAAQDQGYWRAASSTAASITGDIAISKAKVQINFSSFPLAEIRRLNPTEVSAAFDADVHTGIEGTLYRLNIPANKQFLHRNTLCGEENTQWMATYVSGRTMQVAFFSGEAEPVFTFAAISNSAALCGAYTYAR